MGAKKRAVLSSSLIEISAELRDAVNELRFAEPVAYVYNPLDYAWEMHCEFLSRYGQGQREIVFLGMNPGPWGMAQTGVPFGEVAAVRDWMGLSGQVEKPRLEHPKRLVEGLACTRSEVSGARLWGWAQQRFGSAESFFQNMFVSNYCPLVFMLESARNHTPDKLLAAERSRLSEICDQALRRTIEVLQPRMIIGIGAYAEQQARRVFGEDDIAIARILHPSPASPIANRGWAEQAEKQLIELGVLEA